MMEGGPWPSLLSVSSLALPISFLHSLTDSFPEASCPHGNRTTATGSSDTHPHCSLPMYRCRYTSTAPLREHPGRHLMSFT